MLASSFHRHTTNRHVRSPVFLRPQRTGSSRRAHSSVGTGERWPADEFRLSQLSIARTRAEVHRKPVVGVDYRTHAGTCGRPCDGLIRRSPATRKPGRNTERLYLCSARGVSELFAEMMSSSKFGVNTFVTNSALDPCDLVHLPTHPRATFVRPYPSQTWMSTPFRFTPRSQARSRSRYRAWTRFTRLIPVPLTVRFHVGWYRHDHSMTKTIYHRPPLLEARGLLATTRG